MSTDYYSKCQEHTQLLTTNKQIEVELFDARKEIETLKYQLMESQRREQEKADSERRTKEYANTTKDQQV
jgi:hypothetical protein